MNTALLKSPIVQLPAMDSPALELVRGLESELSEYPQVEFGTKHLLHGGMYSRTIRMPQGAWLTGALVKLPTVVIVSGDVSVFTGGEAVRLSGYHVLAASAGRKQAFRAHADTDLTMLYPSNAQTVEEAEAEFTDEAHLLRSRQFSDLDEITITGE